MRFISPRDYQTILKVNTELINEILDTPAVIYKLNSVATQTNSYGESENKIWYTPISVPCRVSRQDNSSTTQLQTVDQEQTCSFYFLRNELEEREIYPEKGDFVLYDNLYYEIHNTKEVQLWGGRTEYKISIVCETHLSRKTTLQLEKPVI